MTDVAHGVIETAVEIVEEHVAEAAARNAAEEARPEAIGRIELAHDSLPIDASESGRANELADANEPAEVNEPVDVGESDERADAAQAHAEADVERGADSDADSDSDEEAEADADTRVRTAAIASDGLDEPIDTKNTIDTRGAVLPIGLQPGPAGAAPDPLDLFDSRESPDERMRRRMAAMKIGFFRAAAAGPERSRLLGAQMRAHFEVMGGAWPTFAMFLASRYDLFHPEFCDELARTRAFDTPIGVEAIGAIIQKDFGESLESLLTQFDERPIWISGLSQMHEGTLRETSEPVWIMILRPDAADRVAADLAIFEQLGRTFERMGRLRHAQWSRTLRELRARLRNHLDARFTAHQMSQQWTRWRDQPGAHTPRVFRRLCSRHVIITECLEGVPLSWVLAQRRRDPIGVRAWFEANGIKPKRLAGRLYNSFFTELIEESTVAADLDPSRILLFRNNHFGLVPSPLPPIVHLEADRVRAVRGLVRHLPQRAYSSAHTDLLGLVEPLPRLDVSELKKHVTRELRAWGQRDAVRLLAPDDRTFSSLFLAIEALFRARRVVMDANVAAALRALRTLERSIVALQPGLRRMEFLQRFFVSSVQRVAKASTRQRERSAATAGPPEVDLDAPFELIDRAERAVEASAAGSLQFANTASKGSFLFERLSAGLAFLVGVAMVATVLVGIDQHVVRLEALRAVRAGRFLVMSPAASWLDLLVVLLVELWILTRFRRLAHRFRARDSALPGRGRV